MPIVCRCVKKIATVDTHFLRCVRYLRIRKMYSPIPTTTTTHATLIITIGSTTSSQRRQRFGLSTRTM